MNTFSEKLSLLRAAMREKNIDYYIIPSTDPHLGEYVPDHWRIIKWITGFSGSAGTVLISESFAGLWTDSRYFLQAENQLEGSGFVLIRPSSAESQDFINWIANKISPGSKIALDGRIFSVDRIRKLLKQLDNKNCSLDKTVDLISDLWPDRPEMPLSTAFDHSPSFCGKERIVKIGEVREEMRLSGLDYQLLTSPEDIMWILNIRGKDFKYSPLLLSYAIIDLTQILLFIDESKIPLKLASEFDRLDIVMLPYEEIAGMLSVLSLHTTLHLNPLTTSSQLFDSIPEGIEIIEGVTIPTLLKAVKNRVEIENIGKVMIKDGVALTKFFYWLEQNMGSNTLSELSAGEKLNILRSESEYYLGPSFAPIVAFNDHGALPHYSASVESDCAIGTNGILLVDSGGQYLDGTTDITRTIAFGKPSAKQKHDFSLVLKGMISLAQAKFPEGSKGYQLDFIARKALWENGLNYGHGTGHGVGFCLNVHEGPQSISPLFGTESKTVIQAGMLISDEPAVYRTGEYGIRTENLLICYEDEETEFGKFLKFETVSLCYIDKTLIDISLMDQKELDWLNAYHSEVYEKLSPYLSPEEKIWLKNKTNSL
jgi:Xaa-Pro aminopeptidase